MFRELTTEFGLPGLIIMAIFAGCTSSQPSTGKSQPRVPKLTDKTVIAKVEKFCGACHPVPSPASFPRSNWPAEVERCSMFYTESLRDDLDEPTNNDTVRYFQSAAPETVEIPSAEKIKQTKSPVEFTPSALVVAEDFTSLTAHVIWQSDQKNLLITDMTTGKLHRWSPNDYRNFFGMKAGEKLVLGQEQVIAEGKNLCRIVPVDWNQDGLKDYVVGEIGSTIVSDQKEGNISLLIGKSDGSLERKVIAEQLARPITGVPFDFDADGDLDVLVAEYGWHQAGAFSLLRNVGGSDGAKDELKFEYEVIQQQHGLVAIELADINGDGRADIVLAWGQEFELLEVMLNQGEGKYKTQVITRFPEPSYNTSSIRIADIDQDGLLDIVHTCGDIFDSFVPKPFHGVRVVHQNADGTWDVIELGMLIGAMQSAVADFDGDGDLDIAAVGLYPGADYESKSYDSVVWFEQKSKLDFERHKIELNHCLHATCDAADVNGDGKVDLIVGEWKDVEPGVFRVFSGR